MPERLEADAGAAGTSLSKPKPVAVVADLDEAAVDCEASAAAGTAAGDVTGAPRYAGSQRDCSAARA